MARLWRLTRQTVSNTLPKCNEAQRATLAEKFNWSVMRLAPHIGLSFQDANDIQEQYDDPKEQRIALLEKWSQKLGKEATFQKLAKGFEAIERNDITEHISDMNKQTTKTIVLTIFGIILIIILCILMVIGSFIPVNIPITFNTTNTSNVSDSNNYTTDDHRIDTIHTMANKEQISWNEPHCEAESAWNDLPSGLKFFVGRKQNITFITKTLQTHETTCIQIININGAPGFGKSALAIHVGHQLVARCIQVRYIDTTEHYWFRGRSSHHDTTTDTNDVQQASLQPRKQSSIQQLYKSSEGYSQFKPAIELSSLVNWARSVEHPTVLILDNCDDILHSSLRDDFLETIKYISTIPHGNVRIIVTSQEKLLLQNNFGSVDVRELDQTESLELLSQFAIGISTDDAMKLTETVGGSPLALRIVGQTINSSGIEFVPIILSKLNTKPLQPLDKVSDRKSKFRVLMDTACNYIKNDTQKCAHCLSYFPGSFDKDAMLAALSSFTCRLTQEHADDLVTHSLLEEYMLHEDQRFKMHRLIREYFREKAEGKYWSEFNASFVAYYGKTVYKYAALYVSQDINEEEEHKLRTESHNIAHLSGQFDFQTGQLEPGQDGRTLLKFSSEIAMQFSKPLVLYSKNITRQIFLWSVSGETPIGSFLCEHISNDTCASYYNVVLDKAHETLCNRNHDKEETFDESCELFHCNITNMTASVCQRFNSTAHVCEQIMSINQWCIGQVSYTTMLVNYVSANPNNVPVVIIIIAFVVFWYRNNLSHSIMLTAVIAYYMYFLILCVSYFVYGIDNGVFMASAGPFIIVFADIWLLGNDLTVPSKTTLLAVIFMIIVSLGLMFYNGQENIWTVIVLIASILCFLLALTI